MIDHPTVTIKCDGYTADMVLRVLQLLVPNATLQVASLEGANYDNVNLYGEIIGFKGDGFVAVAEPYARFYPCGAADFNEDWDALHEVTLEQFKKD